MMELANVFDFGNDVAPFGTAVLGKRVGELIVQATRYRGNAQGSLPPTLKGER